MRLDPVSTGRFRPRRGAVALAVAAVLSCAPVVLVLDTPAFAQARPTNLADLVDSVAEAVVNISATQTFEEKDAQAHPTPDLPKGTPFDDMFEQFFKNHGMNGAPARPRKSSSLGSGFVIDASGIVITNNHVVGDANEILVIFTDGRKLKAKVLGKDAKVDVAVLKVESDKPLKTVKFGDSEKARASISGSTELRMRKALHSTQVSCSRSKSANNVFNPRLAAPTAVSRASVLFPTPPFWLTKDTVTGVGIFIFVSPFSARNQAR